MSRIHDALQKAQREGTEGSAPVPLTSAEKPASTRPIIAESRPQPRPALHPLHDKDLRLVQFSPRGRGALARAYDAIERFVALERGPAMAAGSAPARIVLVASEGPDAVAALALAAALGEKTRSRIALADADAVRRPLSAFFQAHPGTPGFWDLPAAARGAGDDSARGVLRTELSGLYFLPAGYATAMDEGGQSAEAAAAALGWLRDRFHYVVLHAGGVARDGRAEALAGLSDAVLLEGEGFLDASPTVPAGEAFGGRPVCVIEALG